MVIGLGAFAGLGAYVFSLDNSTVVGVSERLTTTGAGGATAATDQPQGGANGTGADGDAEPVSELEAEPEASEEQADPEEQVDTEYATASSAGNDQEIITVGVSDPLGLTVATAEVELFMSTNTGEICYDIRIDGMQSPYDGHIHVGPAGVKGGIVVDLGPLSGDNPTGCLPNSPVDTQAILDDLGGHYVEFHDPDGIRTVRSQLSAADPAASVDDSGDGAVIAIEAGVIRFVGDVPDQLTIDKLVESFADIDLGATTIDTSDLTITPGSPRPSGRILVDDSVLFAVDSDELQDTDTQVLDTLATIFTARPAWGLTIVGHTDATGTDAYNLELSLRRAAAVRSALGERRVPTGPIKIEGAGSTAPIASNETPEGRASNRRIEFLVQAG